MFAFTGIPTSILLFSKAVKGANKMSEDMDRNDGLWVSESEFEHRCFVCKLHCVTLCMIVVLMIGDCDYNVGGGGVWFWIL